MKTFAEAKGEKPFNWYDELSQDVITSSKWGELKEKAKNWTTCACGNQCAIIPRDGSGEPDDAILATLGGGEGFYKAIRTENKADALFWLDAIEKRSEYLIKIELAKKDK